MPRRSYVYCIWEKFRNRRTVTYAVMHLSLLICALYKYTVIGRHSVLLCIDGFVSVPVLHLIIVKNLAVYNAF